MVGVYPMIYIFDIKIIYFIYCDDSSLVAQRE